MSRQPSLRSFLPALLASAAVGLGLLVPATTAPALAATNPYERGPAPTAASIEATRGSFATASVTVSDSATPGFGAATIYYPTSTASGTFGGVAISPGFTATQSSVSWYGPRLASQGFVVITIDTNSRYDQPASRGDQLLAALDYLTKTSSVRTRVDPARLAVMGHSMGGGGSLEAAKDRPALQAAIGLTPYDSDTTWPEVTTPTLLIGAQDDSTAAPARHAIPFYTSLPATTPKTYAELAGAGHSAPTSPNTPIARTSIAWLKRFVDDDLRYQQFLCPTPGTGSTWSDYRATCTWS